MHLVACLHLDSVADKWLPTLLSLFAFHEAVAMGCLLSVDWLGEPLARASRLIVCECTCNTCNRTELISKAAWGEAV